MRRLEESVAQGPAVESDAEIGPRPLEDAAHQRVAVGMQPARGEAEDGVARADAAPVDDLRFLDHADGEPGEVVLALRVHPRHLGGLAADQRAAGELAAARDALRRPSVATATSSLPQAK